MLLCEVVINLSNPNKTEILAQLFVKSCSVTFNYNYFYPFWVWVMRTAEGGWPLSHQLCINIPLLLPPLMLSAVNISVV
jgi:hypothetical protein